MTTEEIRDILLTNGVSNLQEEYKDASIDNILTDKVFAILYKKMLIENRDNATDEAVKVIDSLIIEINKNMISL